MFNVILEYFKKSKSKTRKELQKEENINQKIKELTGYLPKNNSYFIKALTHRSYLETTTQNIKSNERLEFLGDAILGKVTAEYLFQNYPEENEGFLTKSRSHLVNKETLEAAAFNLKLEDFIFYNKKYLNFEKSNIGNLMADALEALIAAIYLEFGIEVTKKFVVNYIIDPNVEDGLINFDNNYKGQLLEYSHSKKLNQPIYEIIEENGPQHDKIFTIKVSVNAEIFGIGKGHNKKSAEQEAAKNALNLIKNHN